MSSSLGRLVGQTGVYTLGNILLKLGGLLVIPIYINVLSPEDFGRFVLLDVTTRILILLAGMGVATGLLRFATHSTGSGNAGAGDTRVLSFTAMLSVSTLGAAGFFLMNLFAGPIADGLLADAELTGAVRLMAVFVAVKVVQSVPMMILRIRERSGLYVSAAVFETVLLIGAVYVFVVRGAGGVEDIARSYAVSSGVVAVILVTAVFIRTRPGFDATLVRRLILFGAPLTMAALSGMFMNVGDRYLLRMLGTIEMVAVYDWAARLGGVVNMIFVQSFQLAFAVVGLKSRPDSREGGDLYRSTFIHYSFWAGWAVLGLGLLSLDLTLVIAGRTEYAVVDVLVFPIALGFFAYGLYYIAVNALYVSERTGKLAMLVLITAVLNAVLNIAFIPSMGAFGAALATAAAYAVLAGLTFRAGADVSDVRYPWSVLARVVGLLFLLWAASLPMAAWAPPQRIAGRLLLIAAYPVLTVLVRAYSWHDAFSLLKHLRKV